MEHKCEPLIDAKQAALILDCSPKKAKSMAATGEVPAIQIGNRWKFRASSLDEWMRSGLLSHRHPQPSKGMQ